MIVLGRIAAPFGIQGWVKVQPFGDDPLSRRKMPTWWLSQSADAPAAAWQPLTLKSCREHGKGLVANFIELPDRNAAEAVEGFYLAAPREALPQPDEDEYYWADLIGLEVHNRAGLVLGVVDSMLETGAHAVLVVKSGDVERLIPFVAAYVGKVDKATGRIEVDWDAQW